MSMSLSSLLVLLFLVHARQTLASSETRSGLESLLRRHDRIHKDEIIVRSVHTSHRKLQVTALDRKFSMHLLPHHDIFATHFKAFVEGKNGSRRIHSDFDPGQFYKGYVEGETESLVTAHLDDDGIVTATISLPHDSYFIEPSWRHVPTPHNYHMIAYRQSDIQLQLGQRFDNGSYSGRFCSSEEHRDEDERLVHFGYQTYRDSLLKHLDVSKRLRRATIRLNTCPMILVADYSFYSKFGAGSLSGTVNYMVGTIISINEIYRRTTFDSGFSGMGLQIDKVFVHDTPNTDDPNNYNYDKTWEVSPKLAAFSRNTEWQKACLAHLFTYHDFANGVLGLAYVASSRRNTVGGICSPVYQRVRSLRIGLTTPVNYGRNLLRDEVDVVTAHEIGHNWGSPHDPTSSNCAGNSDSGRFIMYPSAQDGRKPNNKKFSSCSKMSIGSVLAAKSSSCFIEHTESLCGDYQIEEGEECDAGFDGDHCCSKECKLINGARCSAANYMCCHNCTYASSAVKCREAADNNVDCADDTFCSGNSSVCPEQSPSLPDNSPCGSGGICHNGTCEGLCHQLQMVSCLCSQETERCLVCCKNSSTVDDTAPCLPLVLNASEIPANLGQSSVRGGNILLGDGSHCNQFQGICQNGECLDTVQDALDRFWDFIRNISLDSVVEWLRNNIVADVLIFSLIVWVPVSLVIHYFDRKRIEKIENDEEDYLDVTLPERRARLLSTTADTWAVKPPKSTPSRKAPDEQPLIGNIKGAQKEMSEV